MSFNINELTIGQAREVAGIVGQPPAAAGGEASFASLASDGASVVAVLQRGHVAVGVYRQKGIIGSLAKAAIVRRWGTSKGLGELAEKGPLKNTTLDKCPDISFHIREVIFLMEAKNAWGSYFAEY